MRAVIQRVARAAVSVGGEVVGRTGPGLLIYLGVAEGDTEADAAYLADKAAHLRIFPDDQGRFDRSVRDAGGSALVVSQFTLLGDCRKGRRPGMTGAAAPAVAEPLYRRFGELLAAAGCPVEYGRFGAHMAVESVNDGPVTFLLDSRKLF
jgi:D-tyrosyl-tRNA(Tyr) deacylase